MERAPNETIQRTVRVGVGVVIVKDNLVLLGKRLNAHGEGTWAFPGGHLEVGESWQECALREVAEETGLSISNPEFSAITNDIFDSEGKHYITLFMKAQYRSGQPQLLEPHKCAEWGWFAWDNLPSPLFLTLQNLCAQGYNPIRTKNVLSSVQSQSIYKHYKGKKYRIIAVATHSEDINEHLVIYEALYNNEVSQVWARPLGMFLETIELEGHVVPRFTLLEASAQHTTRES